METSTDWLERALGDEAMYLKKGGGHKAPEDGNITTLGYIEERLPNREVGKTFQSGGGNSMRGGGVSTTTCSVLMYSLESIAAVMWWIWRLEGGRKKRRGRGFLY